MTRVEPRTLRELHRRLTRWEIVARYPGGEERLGFLLRPSRGELIRLAQEAHGPEEWATLGVTDDASNSYSAAGGWKLGAVVICKSGRTERDCAIAEARS